MSESVEIRTELARRALLKALGNMRELAELATTSQSQVLDGIKKRAQESLAEWKKLLQPE